MSTNPFESPVAKNDIGPQSPQPFPTTVLVICILCLILGLLGFFGVCSAGGLLLGAEAMANLMPPEAKDDFLKSINLQFVPMLVQVALGVIFSPLMVVACIGCFTRKPWGRKLLVIANAGFVLWNLLSVGTAIWLTIFHIDALAAPNAPTMGKEGAVQMAYFGQIFAIAFAFAFLAFYAFAAIYMRKQSVVEFFDGVPQQKG